MPFFQLNDGCRIYHECHGIPTERPVVVFLNGTTQTTVNWLPHARALKEHFGVILYDARGQGKSDLGKLPLSLEQHAADLALLLNSLEIKTAHLVGLSHGAHVALAFAAESSERANRIIACSIGDKRNKTAETEIRSWLTILKKHDLETMIRSAVPTLFGLEYLHTHRNVIDKIIRAMVLRNRREALAAHLNAMLAYPSPDDLAVKADCPCLVISADEDPLVDPASAARLADSCNGKHLLIEGAGHSIPAEVPDEFNRGVSEFLMESY
jgi:3-oxoadipate enol-lactonase